MHATYPAPSQSEGDARQPDNSINALRVRNMTQPFLRIPARATPHLTGKATAGEQVRTAEFLFHRLKITLNLGERESVVEDALTSITDSLPTIIRAILRRTHPQVDH